MPHDGRFRIVRQLLTETLVLALLGGGLGLLASFWLARLLRFQYMDPRFDATFVPATLRPY